MGSFLLENATVKLQQGNLDILGADGNNSAPFLLNDQNVSSHNSTSQEPLDKVPLPWLFILIYYTIKALWSVLAIVGNTLTIAVVIKFEQLHTSSNILVCNLAIADLLGGLVVPLFFIHDTNLTGPLFVPVCLLEKTLNLLATAMNLMSILYISIDRYIYFEYPLRYHSLINIKKIIILLCISWVYFTIAIPLTVYHTNFLKVGVICKYTLFMEPFVYYFLLGPQFLLVLFLTVGFYIAIARIAYKQYRKVHALGEMAASTEAQKSQKSKKVTKMLGTILGVFLITVLPQFFMSLALQSHQSIQFQIVEKITEVLYWSNIWVNPIIYALKMKEFRTPLKRLLKIGAGQN